MQQQEAPHPNKLKVLLAIAGLNQREAASEAGIPTGTLRHYVAGDQVIPKRDRIKLAHVIGCGMQDLAPQYSIREDVSTRLRTRNVMVLESHGFFSFGKLKTTSVVLDGDGTEVYSPNNIHTHYDSVPATFFDEVLQAKQQIQQEQEEKQQRGEPYQWNGEKYHLSRIVISREPIREHMTLGLWFKPRDHYIGLATRRCLDNPDFRTNHLVDEWDWNSPIVSMSCSMGVDLSVITSDNYILLTQRGTNLSVNQSMFSNSVSEAVSPLLDRSTSSQAPDLYRCASRGLSEELGLRESVDFFISDILFLSFTVDTHYALYVLRGLVKVNQSAEEILDRWHAGVKDKMENKQIFAVPFTPEDVCSFVFSHKPFCAGLVCLYHTLVHNFGREHVNSAISNLEH